VLVELLLQLVDIRRRLGAADAELFADRLDEIENSHAAISIAAEHSCPSGVNVAQRRRK
jgi:hypothetical protein